jgi:hypothetical protein
MTAELSALIAERTLFLNAPLLDRELLDHVSADIVAPLHERAVRVPPNHRPPELLGRDVAGCLGDEPPSGEAGKDLAGHLLPDAPAAIFSHNEELGHVRFAIALAELRPHQDEPSQPALDPHEEGVSVVGPVVVEIGVPEEAVLPEIPVVEFAEVVPVQFEQVPEHRFVLDGYWRDLNHRIASPVTCRQPWTAELRGIFGHALRVNKCRRQFHKRGFLQRLWAGTAVRVGDQPSVALD